MDFSSRRGFIKAAGASLLTIASGNLLSATADPPILKKIPSTNTAINSIGMGTWQTFNVGNDPVLRQRRCEILRQFFESGGQMIDSSPMYGSSHHVLGHCLSEIGEQDLLFSADKIWTADSDATATQYAKILTAWQQPKIDLMQVHNLLRWEAHLEALQELKAQGKIRYVGVTTSHGRRHKALEEILTTQAIDFVQLTYTLTHRSVENRLLPLAKEKGIAVIANRPFDGGFLPKNLQRRQAPLPPWAADVNCKTWPALLLKFITAHPAITCAIPATTQLEHMQENMQAAHGDLLDNTQRQHLIDYVNSL